MKKIITIVCMVLMMVPSVWAVESEFTAGVTPDSILYGVDVWWDEFRVGLQNDVAEKARMRLEIAEERVQEMKEMANRNMVVARERARQEHQKQLNKFEQHFSGLNEENQARMQQMFQKHIMVLETVLERVPTQAKGTIQGAIDQARSRFEEQQTQVSQEHRQDVQDMIENIENNMVRIRNFPNNNR